MLTGNTRARVEKRLFRKPVLILQVEEAGVHTYSMGGQIDDYPYKKWRDCTVEDLTSVQNLNANIFGVGASSGLGSQAGER